VLAGIGGCTLGHVFQDGLGLEYFSDLNELLAVKCENDHRAQKAAERARNNGNNT